MSYIGRTPGKAVNGIQTKYVYAASASQTTFEATYDIGYVDVFLNGVKLVNGSDYAATTGSTIVLATGADANDVVEIVGYGTYTLNVTAARKNLIINGNFDIWQRGTSLPAGTTERYIADRWATDALGTTIAPARAAFTLGQTSVPRNPKYYQQSVVVSSAGAGYYAILRQKIEDVVSTANQNITLSFWAKADASKNIALEYVQSFGTGGSPSSAVTSIGVTTYTLTTSWQKFTTTTSIPSISGKTLGTDGNDRLALNFWFDAGSNYNARTNSLGQQSGTFDIAQVQLELGEAVTNFEQRSLGEELALCQRYYEKSYDLETAPGTVTTVGAAQLWVQNQANFHVAGGEHISFAVTKRNSPTVTGYSPASGTSGKVRDGGNGADVNFSSYNIGTTGFSHHETTYSAVYTIDLSLHWTADAEL